MSADYRLDTHNRWPDGRETRATGRAYQSLFQETGRKRSPRVLIGTDIAQQEAANGTKKSRRQPL